MTSKARRNLIFDALAELLDDPSITDLERLRALQEISSQIELISLPEAVQRCLDHGETWAAIAGASGQRSRQQAHRQWSGKLANRRLV